MSLLNALISPTDKKDAALMGLLQLGSQFANRGAPRLTPTPPPIDLGKALNVYQTGLQSSMAKNLALAKLQQTAGKREIQKIGADQYAIFDPIKGTYTPIKSNRPYFTGTGFTAQASNNLMNLSGKISDGTANDKEMMAYNWAYNYLGRDRTEQRPRPDGTIDYVKVPGQNLEEFPVPIKTSQTAPGAGQPAQAGTQAGGTVVGQSMPKPPTADAGDAFTFSMRMENSSRIIDSLEAEHGEEIRFNIAQDLAGRVPFLGSILQRKIMTDPQRQYLTAAIDWMRATIRDESGAAIGEQEAIEQFEQYFPIPGDSQGQVAQKREMRARMNEGMKLKAAPAQIFSNALQKNKPTQAPRPVDPKLSADQLRKKYGLGK